MKIVDEPESERDPEVVDKPDSELEVKGSLIETHVDLLVESILELLPSLPVMMVLLSLRPLDVYDLLQIFLNEADS